MKSLRALLSVRTRTALAAWSRTLALLPLLLLLQGGQIEGSLHAHADDHASEDCSLCLHAHAPAIETAGTPSAAPSVTRADRPHLAPADFTAEHAPRLAASRAPPRA